MVRQTAAGTSRRSSSAGVQRLPRQTSISPADRTAGFGSVRRRRRRSISRTHLARLKAQQPRVARRPRRVDNIGASPLLSGLFSRRRPTIESAETPPDSTSRPSGNHEFDEGWVELRPGCKRGSCHPVGWLPGSHRRSRAAPDFQYPRRQTARIDGEQGRRRRQRRAAGLPAGTGPVKLLPEYAVKTIAGVEELDSSASTLQGRRTWSWPIVFARSHSTREAGHREPPGPDSSRRGRRAHHRRADPSGRRAGQRLPTSTAARGFFGARSPAFAAQMPAAVEGDRVWAHASRLQLHAGAAKLVTSAASFGPRESRTITLQIGPEDGSDIVSKFRAQT